MANQMTDQLTITTERLLIGPWTPEDAAAGLSIFGDPEVTRWLTPAMDPVHDEAAMLATLERWAEEEAEAVPPVGHWAVRRGEDEALLGSITLRRMPPYDEDLELAWQFSPSHWGQGYATEACRAMIRFAFDEMRLAQLVTITATENTPSIKLLKGLGCRSSRHRQAGLEA